MILNLLANIASGFELGCDSNPVAHLNYLYVSFSDSGRLLLGPGRRASANCGLCSKSANKINNCLDKIDHSFGQTATYSLVKRESGDEVTDRVMVLGSIVLRHF